MSLTRHAFRLTRINLVAAFRRAWDELSPEERMVRGKRILDEHHNVRQAVRAKPQRTAALKRKGRNPYYTKVLFAFGSKKPIF